MFLYLCHTRNLHGSISGLGLHLKTLVAKLSPQNDLHEPRRMLSSLSEYEHLHRIFRLCHVTRNIIDAAVPENIKNKMRWNDGRPQVCVSMLRHALTAPFPNTFTCDWDYIRE
jgi:hypothetical protein